MIDQERPGARAGERAGPGNLRRAPRGLDLADQGADRGRDDSHRFQGRLALRDQLADARRILLLLLALQFGAEAAGRGLDAVEQPLVPLGIQVAAVAHGSHHGAGGLGRHAGVVDAEAGEQRGARGDPLGQETAGGELARPEQAAMQHGRAVDPRGKAMLAPLGLEDDLLDGVRIQILPPEDQIGGDDPRGGGRRAAEAGADRQRRFDPQMEPRIIGLAQRRLAERRRGLAESDLDEVRPVVAAHGAEALGAGFAGILVPALAGGAGVGAHRLPGGLLGVGEGREIEMNRGAGAR